MPWLAVVRNGGGPPTSINTLTRKMAPHSAAEGPISLKMMPHPALASAGCTSCCTCRTAPTPAGRSAAAAAGLRLADLDDYRTKRSAERALVLGYGNISDTEIPPAVTLLREALRSPVESAAWSGVS